MARLFKNVARSLPAPDGGVGPLLREYALPIAGILLRLATLVYGEWQDRTMQVKFTDIDYYVFTDAARFVAQGGSPYDRETYRYTPLLAWALLPNIYWSMVCGKVLFIVADILCAFLQHHILVLRGTDRQTAWRWVAALWLFNPFVVTITTRGSAEALVALLVLGTLAAVYSRRLVAAGVLFGLAVQFKAYAILYALPIYFYLNADYTGRDRVAGQGTWVGHVRLFFNPSRLSFTFVSAGTFLALSGLMYWMYGWQFLDETFLYHLTRRDHRHNFSPYFYLMYLVSDGPTPAAVSLLAFLPQLVLLTVLSAKFYRDLPFCLFVQTIAFVAFNKVITSQYFIWYITFLPIVWPTVRLPARGVGGAVLAAWIGTQALWLNLAYELEFLGHNTFALLWQASLAFFIAHIALLVAVVRGYRGQNDYRAGKIVRQKRE